MRNNLIAEFVEGEGGGDLCGLYLVLCRGETVGDPLNDALIGALHGAAREGDAFAYQVLHWLVFDIVAHGEPSSSALADFAMAVRTGKLRVPTATKSDPERDWRIANVANDLVHWGGMTKAAARERIADALGLSDDGVKRAITRGGGWGVQKVTGE